MFQSSRLRSEGHTNYINMIAHETLSGFEPKLTKVFPTFWPRTVQLLKANFGGGTPIDGSICKLLLNMLMKILRAKKLNTTASIDVRSAHPSYEMLIRTKLANAVDILPARNRPQMREKTL